MNSRKLVADTIKGCNTTNRTPLYGWVSANLTNELTAAYGSVEAFEDKYEFDMAHLFSSVETYDQTLLSAARAGEELTPDLLLDISTTDVNDLSRYQSVRDALTHHQTERGRFCYIQTPGIFEALNGVFGIENHLCYLAMYPDELHEVYRRQAEWNRQYAMNMLDLGVDMVHISDDWGSQTTLMFSPTMWRNMIFPYHKITCDAVKKRDAFLSLHSDGCIASVLDGVVELGYDVVHPWQEVAGMPYSIYLDKYQDKLAILGGMCVQSTLGFGDLPRLESEIRRVFSLLKGKRWMCCTTHFVQNHCSLEELAFAFDLAAKLARP